MRPEGVDVATDMNCVCQPDHGGSFLITKSQPVHMVQMGSLQVL